MTLRELAIACDLYQGITGGDSDYLEFRRTTNDSPDLSLVEHRDALLNWLRAWGCRQFAKKNHRLASNEIHRWWEEHCALLPHRGRNLWELDESEIASANTALTELSVRTASKRGEEQQVISVGPTGAAKVLFALRPRALPPWDNLIRVALGYASRQDGYQAYLLDTKSLLLKLAASCGKAGFPLDQLPSQLGQAEATVPKLIDEYYWMTITRGYRVPDSATWRRWLQWG